MMHGSIFREKFFDLGIGFIDIFRVARKRYPTEWPFAVAEQRTDICRHKILHHAFGAFYNSQFRQFRLQVRFER